MTKANYWARTLDQRFDRRRMLVLSGGAAATAALLAACGGSSSPKGGGSSLMHTPVDTTKQAKKGGAFKDGTRTDASTFDVHTLASSEPRREYVWSRLTKIKSGHLEPATGEAEGDVLESWEFSPDKLTMTGKIRPNIKLDPRSPTNGRLLDAQDVIFAWERLGKVGSRRADYVNAVNPAAPIVSITAPDPRTVVLKLAAPDADLLTILARSASGAFHIMSKEVDGGYDIKLQNRGSGPYYIAEHIPSVSLQYKRNPGYYDDKVALVETWEKPIVTEYAQSMAQLRAGAVYRFPEDIRPEDILPLKRDIPDLLMIKTDVLSWTNTAMFGFRDGPASQFRDERVRQAYSMSQDRDLWLDTFHEVSKSRAEGLEVDAYWNSCFYCHDFGSWMDPQGKDFGPNAKFFKHDVAEAKKLLAAAGYANGFETNGHYITTGQYGRDYERQIQVLIGMASEIGIKINSVPHSFTSDWPQYRDAVPPGSFDGIAWLNLSATVAEASYLANFHSKGSLFKGFSPDGRSTHAGDPYLDDLTSKLKQEFDAPKRLTMFQELQRYVAQKQYIVHMPGGASGFNLNWPAVGNFGVYRGGSNPDQHLWVDDSKPPFKKA